MIIGIGIDIINKKRIAKTIQGHKITFFKRLFTESEEKTCKKTQNQTTVDFVAKRFSIKESVAKAIGCGIGHLISLRDIEVIKQDRSKVHSRPVIVITDKILNAVLESNTSFFEKIGINSKTQIIDKIAIHISISDEKETVTTMAILEYNNENR